MNVQGVQPLMMPSAEGVGVAGQLARQPTDGVAAGVHGGPRSNTSVEVQWPPMAISEHMQAQQYRTGKYWAGPVGSPSSQYTASVSTPFATTSRAFACAPKTIMVRVQKFPTTCSKAEGDEGRGAGARRNG